MNRFASILMAAALAAPTASFSDQPVWPAGSREKDDPRVLAFYAGMCTRWADQNGLAGDAREAFLAQCRAGAPAVFPVGSPEGGGGGEE